MEKTVTEEEMKELLLALARYTNPKDPEYDAVFTKEIRSAMPSFFKQVEGKLK